MNEHILITGAASGIGAATARLLAMRGQHVSLTLIDQSDAGLQALTADLGMADWKSVTMDVSDPEAWARLDFKDAGFTGAVLCAGVSDAARITDMSFEAWRRVLSVNLDGAFLSLQAALQHCSDGASIVAVSSASGHKAAAMTGAYAASKAGLSQLVKVAALENAERDVRINAIAPGGVKTPMFSDQDFFESFKAEHGGEAGAWAVLGETVPLGRFAEAGEVAGMISFLLGPESATMTGAVLNCDGGYGL
jgi:NAD(P)-dependent dehydrogenase (short-subunit alcohol dehydrogenase family)